MRKRMRIGPLWSRLGIAALTIATAAIGLAVPAQAAPPAFQLPFPCNETWHGDNPGSSRHVTPWELDFNLPTEDEGKPVLAAAAGTVSTASAQSSGFGNLVTIQHGGGYVSYYAHLQDFAVRVGATVSQGQLIGWVGHTSGNASPKPHLHYEVRLGAGYPGNIIPAVFNGVRFPYPSGDITSRNCAGSLKPSKSVNGDRYDDLVAVDSAGVAWVYPGKATGGFGSATRLGPGWGAFTKIGVNDSNGDGWADLFAISGGTLHYWNNRGDGTFSAAISVGSGWTAIEYLSFADVNSDNRTDILARDGGYMYLYAGRGGGSFSTRTLVGPGWGTYARHSASDADADGDGDIWATNGAGDLYFWKRNGAGFASGVDVGSGWNAFRQLTTMDVNGDNRADLIAIKSADNTLWQWFGTGTGTFGQGKSVGSGWGTFQLAAY
jgi:hypothetical protein